MINKTILLIVFIVCCISVDIELQSRQAKKEKSIPFNLRSAEGSSQPCLLETRICFFLVFTLQLVFRDKC